MPNSLPGAEPSNNFVCPSCGVSAFEIVKEASEENGYADSGRSLFMRCFRCRRIFEQQLGTVVIGMMSADD